MDCRLVVAKPLYEPVLEYGLFDPSEQTSMKSCGLVKPSGSTLVQAMACCLTVPSHYLNQCRLIITKVQWHLTRDTSAINGQISLKITYLKFLLNLPGANALKWGHHMSNGVTTLQLSPISCLTQIFYTVYRLLSGLRNLCMKVLSSVSK